MTTGRENTWLVPIFGPKLKEIVGTFVKYPPRPMQSEASDGEMTIDRFRILQQLVPQLKAKGIEINVGQ
jgi:arylsulfatase